MTIRISLQILIFSIIIHELKCAELGFLPSNNDETIDKESSFAQAAYNQNMSTHVQSNIIFPAVWVMNIYSDSELWVADVHIFKPKNTSQEADLEFKGNASISTNDTDQFKSKLNKGESIIKLVLSESSLIKQISGSHSEYQLTFTAVNKSSLPRDLNYNQQSWECSIQYQNSEIQISSETCSNELNLYYQQNQNHFISITSNRARQQNEFDSQNNQIIQQTNQVGYGQINEENIAITAQSQTNRFLDGCPDCKYCLGSYCIKCDSGFSLNKGKCSASSSGSGSNSGSSSSQLTTVGCSSNCSQCYDASTCVSCQSSYYLKDLACVSTLSYEGGYSTEDVNTAQSSASTSSTAALASSGSASVITSCSNPNSQMLLQMLSVQKIYFLLLINIPIPDILQGFLVGMSGSAPVESIKGLNIFLLSSTLGEEGSLQTIGHKFLKNNIPASIIISAGGAIILALIVLFMFGFFFLLINSTCSQNFGIMLFDKLFAGLLTQLAQLLLLVFSFAIFMQFIDFFSEDETQNLWLKIIIFIVSVIVFALITYAQIRVSNRLYFATDDIYGKDMINNSQTYIEEDERKIIETTGMKMGSFIRERIHNGCIKEIWICRVYMIVYVTYEAIIIPFIVVSFRNVFQAQILLLTLTQIGIFSITAFFRPFYHTIDNVFMIVDQFAWCITFIIFTILSYCINSYEDSVIDHTITSEQISVLDNLSLTLIIILVFIQIWNPFIAILKIIIQVIAIIRKQPLAPTNKFIKQKLSFESELTIIQQINQQQEKQNYK